MNQLTVGWADIKSFLTDRGLPAQWVIANNCYHIFGIDGGFSLGCIIPMDGSADQIDFETNFKTSGNKSVATSVDITSQPPFAEPLYRTKRSRTAALSVIPAGQSAAIDFMLTKDLYISGGCVVATGAQIGDYVTAEVYDKNSVIPAPYRAVLCESWPSVARYIDGEWVQANPSGVTVHDINTYPLNAKLTAGLWLRLTYFASATGSDRTVGVNYYLTQKL